MRISRSKMSVAGLAVLVAGLMFTVTPALAATTRPLVGSFPTAGGSSGLAVDQETGNVYSAGGYPPALTVYGPEGGLPVGGVPATVPLPFFDPVTESASGVAVDNACYYRGKELGHALSASECEAFDPSNGDVYVSGFIEPDASSVLVKLAFDKSKGKYEVAGEIPFTGKYPFGKEVAGIAVDERGDVYVTVGGFPVGEEAITEFNPAGVQVAKIEQSAIAEPSRVAVGAPGVMYVGGYTVHDGGEGVAKVLFSPEGAVEGQQLIDSAPQASLVAVDRQGDVFVGERGRSAPISEYGPSGGLLGSFGAGEPGKVHAVAAANETGWVYTASAEPRAVSIYGPRSDIATGLASSVTLSSAVLSGTIDREGQEVTSCAFQYGTSTAYGASVPCAQSPAQINAGIPPVPVSAPVAGLQRGLVYHYRLVETNAVSGAALLFGEDKVFSTGAAIEEESVGEASADTATLQAQINPHGLATTYRFQYSTEDTESCTPSTCRTAPEPEGSAGAGTTGFAASAMIEGLQADTVYHYRVFATNSAGTTVGEDHTFTTQVGGKELTLLDNRQWEMVSPPDKYGASIGGLGEQTVIQAAAGGNAIAYPVSSPTEPQPQSNGYSPQVFSTRGRNGWRSRDISPPIYGPSVGVPLGSGEEYRFYSEDLSLSVVQPFGEFAPHGSPQSLSSEATEQTAFLRQDYLGANVDELCTSGCYRPLVTAANVPEGTHFEHKPGREGKGPQFVGATPDLSHVVLESGVALTETPIPPGPTTTALYEWSAEQGASAPLALINVLPREHGEEAITSSAELGSPGHAAGAVSDGGARVVWTSGASGSPQHLYLRDVVHGETVQLDAPKPGVPPGTSVPQFQFASKGGSRVLFTDEQALTGSSGPGDLYECVIAEKPGGGLGCELLDVTPLGKGGEQAQVQGVLGASEDGSWVYFTANGVLGENPGAVHGTCGGGAGAACNVYVRHGGVTRLVAVVSDEDLDDWSGDLARNTSRVSPDGEWLEFMSQVPLTGYDNLDVSSGKPDQEVYLYHATTGALTCASCDPTGARPQGRDELPQSLVGRDGIAPENEWVAGNVPGWTAFQADDALYQSRYLSNEGRLFFDSNDALVAGDVDGTEDVYEYEPEGVGVEGSVCGAESVSQGDAFKPGRPFTSTVQVEGKELETHGEEPAGCVGLISSGTGDQESAFLDASESGEDVFFVTAAKLSPSDKDTSYDVYDAHACTTKSLCAKPIETPPTCVSADACRAAPTPQPEVFGAPASATFSGPGNFAGGRESSPPAVKKVTKKTVKCRKGFVKNGKGGCIKKKKTNRSAHKPAKGRK